MHWGASSNEPITSPVQHNGTAQAGGATTITLAATASATNDLYNGQVIKIYGDPSTSQGAGQARVIIDYNGGTKQATVDRAWVTNPNNTSTYSILATSAPALDATLHGVNVSAGGIASTAFAADAITASAIAADAIGSSELAATAATEIATAVWAETMTEVASPPAITGTLKAAISWLFALGKNKRTTTASTETLRNDADSGSLGTASVSDDGTTFTRNKWS